MARGRGVGDEGVARVGGAGGRGRGGAGLGVQRGNGGIGAAVGGVGGCGGVDVEERGAVGGGVAADLDGDGWVAVFYPGQHFAPEFPGCVLEARLVVVGWKRWVWAKSRSSGPLSLLAVENVLNVQKEKVCVPRASVSAVDLGVELHANLRHLLGQHQRAGPTSYP